MSFSSPGAYTVDESTEGHSYQPHPGEIAVSYMCKAVVHTMTYGHLPAEYAAVTKPFCDQAHKTYHQNPGHPDTYECLVNLRRAKDLALTSYIASKKK